MSMSHHLIQHIHHHQRHLILLAYNKYVALLHAAAALVGIVVTFTNCTEIISYHSNKPQFVAPKHWRQ